MRRSHSLAALLAVTLTAASPADTAEQMVGLFIQGCLPFVGNAAALRGWAAQTGLPQVPAPARKAFLHGAPGQVFDGSNDAGKFVLVSSDDGICSVVTDKTSTQALSSALESGLQRADLTFRLVIERDDKTINAIHNREYLAAHNGQGWRILAASVKGSDGQAMLTAAPE